MHTKTMEGLIGARTNMNLMNTPMHVYEEAIRKRRDEREKLEKKIEEKETGKEQGIGNKSESIPVTKDEYIRSEQSGNKISGLYHMGKDGNGNPKVMYDDPKKAGGADGKVRADSPEEAEKCTANTDKVDREIEKLKRQKLQLEQQINGALGDEEKVEELKKKLFQVEGELSQKDNDTYRRQNAVIS